jgi:acetyl esterase/lipase
MATMFVDTIRHRLVLPCWVFLFCLSSLHAGTTADGFVYSDHGSTITITGYTGSGGAVVIPGTINNEPVVAVGNNAFHGRTGLTNVSIPTSVTSIGNDAFRDCTGLINVYFEGNAPASFGRNVFTSASPGFLVYHIPSATGFTNSWHGYKASIIQPTFPNLVYATVSPLEKLDLYLPVQPHGPAPLVVWIHGGQFTVGDKSSMPRQRFGPPPVPVGPLGPYQAQVPDVAALLAKGYAVVSLNYRLGTGPSNAEVLMAVQDAKAAIRFLRANASTYNLDPTRFAVWGNSAGGYMAATLGATGNQSTPFDDLTLGNAGISSVVQAVVDWYGPINPTNQFIAFNYLWTANRLPPFDLAYGGADRSVPYTDGQILQADLVSLGAVSTLTIVPGAGHEDPLYMETQMIPTFNFLDRAFAVTPPSITSQPEAATAAVGGSFTLSVTATGTAPLNYQWFFNGVAIAGATSSGYTNNNVQTSAVGTYNVVVSNHGGSVKSSAVAFSIPGYTPPAGNPGAASGRGGSPSLWFYGVLGLLAVARKFARKGAEKLRA